MKDMRIDFRLNATERVVMINIFDNNVYEGDKLFAVQLSLVSGARIRVSPSTVTVRIIEDDQQPSKCIHITYNTIFYMLVGVFAVYYIIHAHNLYKHIKTDTCTHKHTRTHASMHEHTHTTYAQYTYVWF